MAIKIAVANDTKSATTMVLQGDSLFCGKAAAVATCPRHVAKSRLSNPPSGNTH
jgi:hypothetical protein